MDTEVTEPNRPNLIKKKNTKSTAWNFFGIEADEHGVSIVQYHHKSIGPSERVFSKGGIIVNAFRSRLKPQHVNSLVFLSKNME
jgi:hypothetical protein